MKGRTNFDIDGIAKMTKKKVELGFKGNEKRLTKALSIWHKANPKKESKPKNEE